MLNTVQSSSSENRNSHVEKPETLKQEETNHNHTTQLRQKVLHTEQFNSFNVITNTVSRSNEVARLESI